jgi:hypothetical protein
MNNIMLKICLFVSLLLNPQLVAYCANETASSLVSVPPSTSSVVSSKKPAVTASLLLDFQKEENPLTFSDWVNSRSFCVRIYRKYDSQKIREDWERMLGIDVFMPYYKADEIKDKLEEKTKVQVIKLRGKAELSEEEAKYTFSIKF